MTGSYCRTATIPNAARVLPVRLRRGVRAERALAAAAYFDAVVTRPTA
jgi:hypothetical protein